MPKITIRPQRLSDAKRFYEILANPNFKYFTAGPKSIDDERKFLAGNAQRRKDNMEHNYAILFDGKVVGGIGIKINQHRPYIGEIGYFVDEDYWGKGIATKATKLMEKIGLKDMKLSRIEIVTMPKNIGSNKVAIKCGYKKEGKLQKALKDRKGKSQDAWLYAKVN